MSAAVNSSTIQKYQAKDFDLDQTGNYYYRLQQVDLNGAFVYSEIVLIRVSNELDLALEMYPNPTTDLVNLDISLKNPEKLDVSIWDISGKLIRANVLNVQLEEGQNTKTINLEGIPAGMYTLHIKVGQDSFKKKLIVVDE